MSPRHAGAPPFILYRRADPAAVDRIGACLAAFSHQLRRRTPSPYGTGARRIALAIPESQRSSPARFIRPRLLDRTAAAAYCGVSVNHFLEHLGTVVEPVMVGSKRLWDRRTIDRWIDGLRVGVDNSPDDLASALAEI
jgi:hypothetical protein